MKKYLIEGGDVAAPFALRQWVKSIYAHMGWTLKDDWEIQAAPYYAWDGQQIRWLDRDTSTKLDRKEYPIRFQKRAIADPLWESDDELQIGDPVYAEYPDGSRDHGILIGISLSCVMPFTVEMKDYEVCCAKIVRARPRVALSWEELEEKLGCELTLK